MTEYLVELYLPRLAAGEFPGSTERARIAAAELSSPDGTVQHLHSIFVPADETCFHLYAATSAALVRAAASRAGFAVQRISEAIADPPESRVETGEHPASELGA